MNTPSSAERGNVLFYILIAVVLLAALIFAVSQSGRGSVQEVNTEKSKLLGSEIIEYANTVATAYSQLRLRGCKADQISFETSGVIGASNPNAPVDKTCHIFELAGGGVTFKNPPREALSPSAPAIQRFTEEMEVAQVGTTCGNGNCTEVTIVSGHLSKGVCIAINEALNITVDNQDPPTDECGTSGLGNFEGDLNDYFMTMGDETNSPLLGKTAGCFFDVNDNTYNFYKVLLSR